jgi:hypothetical protein
MRLAGKKGRHMRRALLSLLSLVVVLALASPASAAGAAQLRGTATGTGRLSVSGGGCIAEEAWTGTLRASVTGPATFTGGICLVSFGTFGSLITITTQSGAVTGVSFPFSDLGSTITYTITSGTGRFAGSSGSITLVITTTSVFDCDPRVGICFGRTFDATISGAVRLRTATSV